MTPIQAMKKFKEKVLYNNLKNSREVVRKATFELGQLVRTAGIKKVLSKGDSTNYSYELYTITQIIHDTIPSYKFN